VDIILLGFIASGLAGLATAAGAIPVFFVNKLSEKFEDGSLGFAAGVMLAASFFSLIIPGFNFAVEMYDSEIFSLGIVIVGLLTGAGIIWIVEDKAPHEHFVLGQTHGVDEKLKAKISKVWLFIIAITLHNMPEGLAVGVGFGGGDIDNGISLATGIGLQNIPEGLAVGVLFGGVAAGIPEASIAGAVVLAFGIGLQNFPEGIAVAMPLRRSGLSKRKSFWYGQLSAIVEPIAGVIGALAVTFFTPLLPYALAFAAGAMIFVVVEEVIPETQLDKYTDIATLGFIGGFIIMMTLDVALG